MDKLRALTCMALLAGLAQAASAAEILIVDAKSQPESLTVAPGGVLIVGSASTSVRLQGARGLDHRREVRGCQRRRCRHLFLRHACGCRYQHAVDVSAHPGAGRDAGEASHRAEELRSLHRRPEAPLEPAGVTTAPATISRSDRTRRSTSPTPPTARSTSCRPVLPLPNYSWSIARSTASTGSPF